MSDKPNGESRGTYPRVRHEDVQTALFMLSCKVDGNWGPPSEEEVAKYDLLLDYQDVINDNIRLRRQVERLEKKAET